MCAAYPLKLFLLRFAACLFFLSVGLVAEGHAAPRLFVVGGGTLDTSLLKRFLTLCPHEDPRVLIIPHAAAADERHGAGRKLIERFRGLGISQVSVLDLESPMAADLIRSSQAIWFSGGSQARLMRSLEGKAAVLEAIRQRTAEEVPVGGTSAGAAIMSRVMIASSVRDPATGRLQPVISAGLGLLPEVIIDQHFSQRNRLSRLEVAVRQHPNLTGIGIDERTAIVFEGDDKQFLVVGKGSVTVIRHADVDMALLKPVRLRAGERFAIAEEALPANH